ncbi:MAG: molecular chaperone TorD family protein [Betaproteobacteria bacterium]|nr:MAG: molecular chaperone TorD family protein [Betaproteobacteria bacterium]
MLKHTLAIPDEKAGVGETAAIFATLDERVAECRARATVYRLLSGAFIEEASVDFLNALRTPDTLAQFAEAGLRFDSDFLQAPVADLAEALSVEYATQFAASGGFPPVESVRLFGRYKQEPNFQTMRTYQRHAFALRPGRHEVFADQLGVELLFVAELLDRVAAALVDGDEATARKLDKEIKRFWVQHLGRWVRGYAGLIESASQHSFYREMARFLGGFADEEIATMGLAVDDADQSKLVVPKVDVKVEFDPNEPVCNGCVGDAIARQDNVQALHDLR